MFIIFMLFLPAGFQANKDEVKAPPLEKFGLNIK
jgi:hypothetical protein